MITVIFAPAFVRKFKNLEKGLQEEAAEKIDLFRNRKNHRMLKVHKLHGKISELFSFSVNFSTRIIFQYESKDTVDFLDIGGHGVYK